MTQYYLFYKALCLFQLCFLCVFCPANWLRVRISFEFTLKFVLKFALKKDDMSISWI